jgi:carbonic anhydrase/acetyltransferase-like protein (isoleucine patch superfamily)
MMTTQWRALSAPEIEQLSQQGCTCSDWSKVQVAAGFRAERVQATHFCGTVRLGAFDREVPFFGGVTKPTGIRHATIHNCTIGDNVYISAVRNYIANYVIEDEAVIDSIDLLAVEGESAFGNGTQVAVVNEAGGREVPIYDRLSAQTAYILAFYQYRPQVVRKLRAMIDAYTASVRSGMGFVGRGARIMNSRLLKNLRIGPAATVEGVNRLENGSINSCPEDPVYIGPGVYAENFIVASGSTITDGTIVSDCFVGQGCVLAKQYSAENSVFFANCGGFHGEACSIFAGPYTVTHHKSTLLIAGLFSFLNAGSGTNQSNHMYKLGPVHQGVVERGSKTGSDSYMLWPAKVGAFTVVMGRHYRNSDTSDLPFSYLIEHEDESVLAPGVNLRSVGTVRDARKWPKRDRRKDPQKLDYINFKLLSPYTIQKMINGRDLLRRLKSTTGHTSDYFIYHNVKIPSHSLDRGIRLYQIGIDKFLGNCVIKRLENRQFQNVEELRVVLRPDTAVGPGPWLDLAGLFAPEEAVRQLLGDIESGAVGSLGDLEARFAALQENYPRYEWAWAADVLQRELNKTIEQMTATDIVALTHRWKKAVLDLDQQLYEDTRKEFAVEAQTGFGLDGDDEIRSSDFAAVRGTFEADSFVAEIRKHMAAKTELGNELLSRVEPLEAGE